MTKERQQSGREQLFLASGLTAPLVGSRAHSRRTLSDVDLILHGVLHTYAPSRVDDSWHNSAYISVPSCHTKRGNRTPPLSVAGCGASKGLRTLLTAKTERSEEQYSEWLTEFQAAETSMEGREEKVRRQSLGPTLSHTFLSAKNVAILLPHETPPMEAPHHSGHDPAS